jgi:hypothetical protein
VVLVRSDRMVGGIRFFHGEDRPTSLDQPLLGHGSTLQAEDAEREPHRHGILGGRLLHRNVLGAEHPDFLFGRRIQEALSVVQVTSMESSTSTIHIRC